MNAKGDGPCPGDLILSDYNVSWTDGALVVGVSEEQRENECRWLLEVFVNETLKSLVVPHDDYTENGLLTYVKI